QVWASQEVGLLLERWEQAREGRGQVVVLSGEAGIGKSRLVRVLQDHVVGDAHTWLQGRCSPYHQRTALYAVVELIQGILQWQETDTPAVKRMKLEQAVRQAHLPVEETVRRVADLLSLPLPGPTVAPRPLDPEPERQQLFAALLALLHAATAEHPVILIVEDLHWADPSTLDLLAVLIAQTPTVPMLLMLTCRPEFQSPWAMRSYMAQVTLTRLSREQMAAMVAHLMGSKELPDALLQHLISQTDGVPLFIEELTKAVLESGVLMETEDGYALTQPVSALAIPTTLHDALMARLDRLGTAKEVAQLGAVIGRQFSYALLQAVSQREHTTLQQALAELVEAELLYQRGLPPQATYQFKHALIQDAAYQSLLRRTRRNLHQRLVQVVAERFPDLGETQPEWLAHHYEEAGLPEQAVPAWHRAGDQAARRAANPEAIGHFTKALDLLRTLPESPERRRHALILHIALGERLELTRGTAAPEVEQAYTRAYELCQQMEDTPLLDRVLTGLFSVYFMRTALPHARELAEELLSHAQRQNDPSLLVNAYSFLGLPLFDAGEIAPARAYFGQAIALYDLQFHPQQQLYDLVFHDVGVRCHTNEALALWYLGYADQALARNQEGFALAEERSRPFRLSTVLNGLARIHQCRREVEAVRERAETAITLSREHGFPDHLAISTHLRGWALAMQGQAEEGIAQMRQGLAAYETTGVERLRPDFLINLAEVYGHVEQYETALTMLAEALAHVEATGQRVYEAEIVRLQGELLLAQSPDHQPQAETCFHRALDIARHQQAKALELRAATSLARLWQSQDKPQAAYDLLAPIYGWFTEGFDTADLQEAKALLAELT
ncbi:MAG: AAA family ATPase, partial [Candidatus Tectomicrobia bacterium]|nr:AAA family ATPase [Candidatus Tectomicrobia bacterium]